MQSAERIDFALNLIEILKQQGTEGLTETERKEFIEALKAKLNQE